MNGVSSGKVILVLGLMAVAAIVNPFASVVVGIWALVAFCLRYKRAAERGAPPAGPRGFRYHLCAFGVLYLIPIGFAMTFYVLLSLWVSWFGDSMSVDRLIAVQRTFENVSAFFSDNLKLSELEIFVVLVAIYALSSLLLPKWRRGRRANAAGRWPRLRARSVNTLYGALDGYTKYSGPIAAGLATLAAFTFFGMGLGEPAKDLELRVKVAQEGYAEITKKIEARLSQRIGSGLYVKIKGSFPASYQTALTQVAEVEAARARVESRAAQARTAYNLSVPEVDGTLEAERTKGARFNGLNSDLRTEAEGRRHVPEGMTPERVADLRAAVDAFPAAERIEVVNTGHKRITLQVEKVVSEQLIALLKPLMQAVPILEPLLATFAEVADATLQERIAKAYDRAAAAVMRNPGQFESAVARAADSVVAETDVRSIVKRATPRAMQQAAALRLRLSQLEKSDSVINKRITEKASSIPEFKRLSPELQRLLRNYYGGRFPGLRIPPYGFGPPGYYRPPPGYPGIQPRPMVPPRPPAPRPPPPRIFIP
ncbi:MAG TPA: hypothetical protein VE465_16140 [Streptosporangiaceae bacterium]|jgi:hypothetical protein|nr:hypothetical protein [Streptosporangiaceae bacterium]